MELEKIFKLIEAGYTKADIEAMTAPADSAPEAEEPAEKQPEPAAPEPVKDEPAPAPVNSRQDEVLEALNRLTNMMITRNINTTVADSMPERSATDILADIIAPPKPKLK